MQAKRPSGDDEEDTDEEDDSDDEDAPLPGIMFMCMRSTLARGCIQTFYLKDTPYKLF